MPTMSDASGAGYEYTHVPIEKLEESGSDTYCIATIFVDESWSVNRFKDRMEGCLRSIHEALKKNPSADKIVLRVLAFGGVDVREVHGFLPVAEVDPSVYVLHPDSTTPLSPAAVDATEAMVHFAEQLDAANFIANGIVVGITDGIGNVFDVGGRHADIGEVKTAFEAADDCEFLDSALKLLVGVGIDNPKVRMALKRYETGCGFDAFESVENTSAAALAKVMNFVSSSVVSQSQAVGTGGPSQILTFN